MSPIVPAPIDVLDHEAKALWDERAAKKSGFDAEYDVGGKPRSPLLPASRTAAMQRLDAFAKRAVNHRVEIVLHNQTGPVSTQGSFSAARLCSLGPTRCWGACIANPAFKTGKAPALQ